MHRNTNYLFFIISDIFQSKLPNKSNHFSLLNCSSECVPDISTVSTSSRMSYCHILNHLTLRILAVLNSVICHSYQLPDNERHWINTPAWTGAHIYSHSQARSWRIFVQLLTDGHRWHLLYCEIQQHLGRVTGKLHLYGDFLSECMISHTASPCHYCCSLSL